jgi:hypothetical protein
MPSTRESFTAQHAGWWLKAREPYLSGPIIVDPRERPLAGEERVAIYARVSSVEHREHLERHVELLVQ